MRRTRFRSALAPVLAVGLFLLAIPRAHAQDEPPNIVGSYDTAGAFSYVNCGDLGVPETTFPLVADLTITDQTGGQFHGTVFDDGQGGSFISFQGTVNAAGQISGTWQITNIPDDGILNEHFVGAVENGRITVDFTADFGFEGEEIFCSMLISLSSGAIFLSWTPPDEASGAALPPPRDLTVVPLTLPGRQAGESTPGSAVTGYKVYRSSQPNVQPSPNNIFATLPPGQTAVPASAGLRGSYFVVTACYAAGESDPSNEVVASATPGPTILDFNPTNKKITALGTGFVQGTTMEINGVGFVAAPKVKPTGTKFTQKGKLANGMTIKRALQQEGPIQITFRNPDGGVTNLVIQ
jgi:hypothetical protein